MNFNIVAGLLKLAKKYRYEEKIRNLIEYDEYHPDEIEEIEEWKSKYKYFGEAIEREESILEEKILAYALAKHAGFDPLTINDYQIKEFEKIIVKEKDNKNPYVKFAFFLLDGNISHFDDTPLTMEEFSKIRYIFKKESKITVLDVLMRNIKDMLKSPCICKDILIHKTGYKCINEVFEALDYVIHDDKKYANIYKLQRGKVSETNKKYLCNTFNISELEVICLNFYILQLFGTSRSATNAFPIVLNALAEEKGEWNDLEKTVFDYIINKRYMPANIESENDIRYVFIREDIMDKFSNISNHNHALNIISQSILPSYSFDIFEFPKKIHNNYFKNKTNAACLFLNNIRKKDKTGIDETRKLFEKISELSLWDIISTVHGHNILKLFKDTGYINIFEEYKNGNIKLETIEFYAKVFKDEITYQITNDLYSEGKTKDAYGRIYDIIPRYVERENFYLNASPEINKNFIYLVACILAEVEQFDKLGFLILNILYNKEYSLKVYSEDELKALLTTLPDIMSHYKKPIYRAIDEYLCEEHIDKVNVLYMTEEEKTLYRAKKKKQEEAECVKVVKDKLHSLVFFENYNDSYKAAHMINRVPNFTLIGDAGKIICKDICEEFLSENMVLTHDDIHYLMKSLVFAYNLNYIDFETFKTILERIKEK